MVDVPVRMDMRPGGQGVAVPFDHEVAGEGKSPDGLGVSRFYIEKTFLNTLRDHGPEWKLEDAKYIEEAISDPDAIFEGLNRTGLEDGVAYSVRPSHDPEEPEVETLPHYGYTFVVYARPGGWGYVIINWDWRAEDSDSPGHPEGWEADFTRRSWSKL